MKKQTIGRSKSAWVTTQSFPTSISLEAPRFIAAGFFFLAFLLVSLLASRSAWAVLESGPTSGAFKSSASSSGKAIPLEEVPAQPFGERKTLRGSIGAFNKQGMAFVIKQDKGKGTETEMWLPFNATVRFSGYRSATELSMGDEVVVTYEEDKQKTKRVLREINFVAKGKPVPVRPESPEPEEAE